LYKIAPYGEGWLLSLSILFVVFGVIGVYFVGRLIGGKGVAFCAFCLAAVSRTLITQGGWELRPYGMLFCVSVWTMFFYYRRLGGETTGKIVVLGLLMMAMSLTHWFGSLLIVSLGLTDLWLWIKGKISLRCVLSYVMAALAFAPWFILVVASKSMDLLVHWAAPPRILSLFSPADSFLSPQGALFLFLLGVALIIRERRYPGKILPCGLNPWLQMAASYFGVCLVVWVYSKFINPRGSLYVNRYFFELFAHVLLIAAYALDRVIEFKIDIDDYGADETTTLRLKLMLYARNALVLFICIASVRNYYKSIGIGLGSRAEPYRQASELLAADERAYAADSLIITASVGRPWVDYYFKKRGFPLPANIADGSEMIVANGKYLAPEERESISKESLSRYSRVYLLELHPMHDYFKSDVEQNYDMAEKYENVGLSVWERGS
jgi:hypothetical protein